MTFKNKVKTPFCGFKFANIPGGGPLNPLWVGIFHIPHTSRRLPPPSQAFGEMMPLIVIKQYESLTMQLIALFKFHTELVKGNFYNCLVSDFYYCLVLLGYKDVFSFKNSEIRFMARVIILSHFDCLTVRFYVSSFHP